MPERKIKILHLIPTLDKGGAERLLVDLTKKIDKEKFDVEVLSLTTLGKWGFELKKSDISVASLGKKSKGSIFVFWKLYQVLKNKKPDILHTHLFGADLYGLLAGRMAKIPYIISTEHNLNFSESLLRRFIKKKLAPKMDKIIAVSDAVKEYLHKEGVNTDHVKVVYNGIDASRFIPKDVGDDSRGFIIGSIGRLTLQKDYKTLIEAMVILKDEKISCLLAGKGSEKKNLEKLVEKNNLLNKFMFLGVVDAVPEFLGKLDMFVLPSRWEGFGLVILEAGASKLPVVASDVDGIKEIIRNNHNGLLFKAGDAGDLAKKIKELISNKEKRERLAKELYKNTKDNFSIDKMVKKYEKIYLSFKHENIID
jgi:glycosyltransferase involved in cell wall biosynthesis